MSESAADFYWYHSIDLPCGERTDGDYDIEPIIPNFCFPEMKGLSVLDVGRASGGFSFEFERRGANVTALDIQSFLEWDFVGGPIHRLKILREIGDCAAFSKRHIYGAFDYAHKALGSNVRPLFMNAYHIDPSSFPEKDAAFDIVFAGSITSHLRDPALAFQRMRSVAKGTLIVSAPCFSLPGTDDHPLMMLVTGDADRRSWWVMNGLALVELLLAAGFARAEIKSFFRLKHRRADIIVDHLVAHAFV
jgi:SAM-dependent methyltransferase